MRNNHCVLALFLQPLELGENACPDHRGTDRAFNKRETIADSRNECPLCGADKGTYLRYWKQTKDDCQRKQKHKNRRDCQTDKELKNSNPPLKKLRPGFVALSAHPKPLRNMEYNRPWQCSHTP